MSLAKAKIPVLVSACLLSLAIGVAGGVFGMTYFGYALKGPRPEGTPLQGMPPGGMMGMQGGGMMGMKGGGMMGMKGGGMNNPKTQLASLVVKIDRLSQKPLKMELTEEQKKKVLDAFQGLADKKELSNEEAGQRLKTILEILKDHKEVLQAVGVRMPDQVDAPPGPNPFLNEETQKHLQSLKKIFGVGNPL